MKTLSVIVFAILATSVHSSGGKFEKDKQLFHAFLKEVYGHHYQMTSFIQLMWPELQRIVPETVKVPAVETFDIHTDFYMCATETEVQAKIGKILSIKQILRSNEKVTLEVECELSIAGKPLVFGIAKKLNITKASPTIHVSYLFKDPLRVRIMLEVYNFLGKREILTPTCVIRVRNILAVGVSPAEPLFDIDDHSLEEIVQYYEANMSEDKAKTLASVSLAKAVHDQLTGNENFWVCSSKYFNMVQQENDREWKYTDNYKKYCLKKEID